MAGWKNSTKNYCCSEQNCKHCCLKGNKSMRYILILAFVLIFPSFSSVFASTDSSSVLDDLSQDSTFDFSEYKDDFSSRKIELITIAEGSDNSLFVYVYQPCHNLFNVQASSINISRDSRSGSYKNYNLDCIQLFSFLVQKALENKERLK